MTIIERVNLAKPLRIALVIGVNQYEDDYYTNLEGAINDAHKVSSFLEKYLDFESTFLANPIAADVEKVLSGIRKKLEDDSVFIFYFAGHGMSTEQHSDRQSLFCADATEDAADGSSGVGTISPRVITKFVREGRGDMFFCFDACRTPAIRAMAQNRSAGNDGITTEGTRAVRDSVASVKRSRRDGRPAHSWTLSSCGDCQLASDDGKFVDSLLKAMSAGLASGKGIEFGDNFVKLVKENLDLLSPKSNQQPVGGGSPFTLATGSVIFDGGLITKETPVQKLKSTATKSFSSEYVKSLLEELEKMRQKVSALEGEKTNIEIKSRVLPHFELRDGEYAGDRCQFKTKGVTFEFRYCPAGTFMMGSPENEKGRDTDEFQHEVSIDEGFWICETPTTQEQWNVVGCKKARECRFEGAKRPVENVTWYESDAFVKRLNDLGMAPRGWRWALPTEEQWEYACRAGTTGVTYGSPLDNCAWYNEDWEIGSTHDVGKKKANNWHIFDMLGNVSEWTSSKREDGSAFIMRGGGWNDNALGCRPALRDFFNPSRCRIDLGFRIAIVRS